MRHSTIYLMLCIALAAITSQAAAVDWDGGGGDLDWTNPNNWSTNLLPSAGDDVVINHASANGQTILNFHQASFANITIGATTGNLMGGGLDLEFTGDSSSGFGFGSAGGEMRVKSGTGGVALSVLSGADFGLNDSDIFIESGVTGDFQFLTGGARRRVEDYPGDNVVTSMFTNNSTESFNINLRGGNDNVEFTLHSDSNGTFDVVRQISDDPNLLDLTLSGDARLNLSRSVIARALTAPLGTEITGAAGEVFATTPTDNIIAGQLSGDISLRLDRAEAAMTLTNDDTYTGTTILGNTGSSNQDRNHAAALIREGTHTGGDDYILLGGYRDTFEQDAILGGSGVIELQPGASIIANRDPGIGSAEQGRATIAPGNVGFDLSGVDNNGDVFAMTLGNQGIGTMTVSAEEVVFGDYSRFEVQLNGPMSDQLNILAGAGGNTNAGNLDLTSTLNELFIDADLLGDANGDTYTLLSWEGTRTGEFDQVWLQDDNTLIDLSTLGLSDFLIDSFEYDLVYHGHRIKVTGNHSGPVAEVKASSE